jgi:EthD domain
MIKRMTLLQRRPDMSVAAFRDHWATGHAQLAASMNGVVKYTQNRIDESITAVCPEDAEAYAPDGIVELYFADAEEMARAQQSQTGRNLIPEDEPLFLRGWTLCIVSTDGPHDHAGTKVMVPVVLAPSASIDHVKASLVTSRGNVQSGLLAFSINVVSETAKRPTLWSEPIPPQLIVVTWFTSHDAARQFWRARDTIKLFSKASACVSDPLVIR